MANSRQLGLIEEIVKLCDTASIPCWLRGGWATDFFLGRVTREHDDIDLFVWAEDAVRLVHELERAGFVEQGGPPPEAQRDFTKDGEQVQAALLARNQWDQVVVAGGPATGTPWPDDMLASITGRIGDVVCPIVNPRVQMWIKEQFPIWRPDVLPSAKHQADVARLREALAHTEG